MPATITAAELTIGTTVVDSTMLSRTGKPRRLTVADVESRTSEYGTAYVIIRWSHRKTYEWQNADRTYQLAA